MCTSAVGKPKLGSGSTDPRPPVSPGWGGMTALMQRAARRSPASFLFSLRGRLLFLICLATLPAMLFTFFAARNERAAALARTEQAALQMARLASREHAHQIRGARELLLWLGAGLAREGMQSPIITDPSFLRALLAGHPQLANIGVLTPDGQVLTSAYPLASYRSWKDNPAYLASLDSDTVATGTYLISPIFERPTLNHAFAVRDANHNVIAVVFNGLDLDWFSAMAREADVPDGFSLYIVDHDGRVLADGAPAPAGAADAPAPQFGDLSGVTESETGRMLEVDSAGVRRYVVAVRLAEMPGLLVAVSLPYDRVVQQANSAFYRTLAALGVLTLFNIVAVFIAAELGVLRSVRSLARVARRFGAGDLAARAQTPHRHDEFATLVTEFNTMADTVAIRHYEALDAQARLRALASRLHVARETEAARISRELHDEIGQLLTSLKIDLSRLQSCCPLDVEAHPCAVTLGERAAAMTQQIDAAVGFVRRISSELRPGVLDKLGLTAALEWQSGEIEKRTGLAIHVETDVDDRKLGELLSVTLFRIAQEALTNVVRHADANTVVVGLEARNGDIVLTVRDDGSGITPAEAESGESLGIIGMRERTTLINGRLSIHSEPGAGTTVTVTAPFVPREEAVDAHPAG